MLETNITAKQVKGKSYLKEMNHLLQVVQSIDDICDYYGYTFMSWVDVEKGIPYLTCNFKVMDNMKKKLSILSKEFEVQGITVFTEGYDNDPEGTAWYGMQIELDTYAND